MITREYGIGQVGLQLGHRHGSKVTEESYVERELLVPDSTAALERFAGEHPTAGKVRDDSEIAPVPGDADVARNDESPGSWPAEAFILCG
ncbi:hypothetical protein ACIA8C_17140 [Nocardia sp. NPDC051321]|uniref:hypothetical protein n=1 Tax=Nocardia sp. NPDC051321 TaxID=3364323 RepID=UPI00378FFBE7